ncbi:MAG: hypothetical protein AB6733_08890 [Clostridiaceae bacterium]
MKMKHLLLEVYCDCNTNNEENNPKYCANGVGWPGSHCFENSCKFLSYTNCSNEIAYAGDIGVVEKLDHFIGFGGDMTPEPYDKDQEKDLKDKWKEICVRKISEAYEEYMKYK